MIPHRDTHTGFRVLKEQPFRQAGCFLPEKQITVFRVAYVRMSFLGFCRKKEKISGSTAEKIGKTFIIGNVQKMPVIQPGSFQLSVIYCKAHRAHQMEPSPGGGAGSSYVPGVLGNFGLHQNDVELMKRLAMNRLRPRQLLPEGVSGSKRLRPFFAV